MHPTEIHEKATHIQLRNVCSILDEHFYHISKINITNNRYKKILMFSNKKSPGYIYFNVIIIQLKSSTYNSFSIFK
jgi:hypothetical protein